MNFAVGRARARTSQTADLINVSMQVDKFLQKSIGLDLAQTLCAIEIGANDIRAALKEKVLSFKQSVDEIDLTIRRLYERKVRNFLVWNIPDIGMTPALRV